MRLGSLLLAAAVCVSPCLSAHAASFSEVVAFGDSLSDNGNIYIGTLGAYPGTGYGYYNGYQIFTNSQTGGGPAGNFVDQLAGKLGVAAPGPSLAGGTDFAFGGAYTSGLAQGVIPGMDAQVGLYLASVAGKASSSALYTFWGGANDIFDGLNPVTAADNIAAEIATVATDGGKTFLWLNLPPLGDTPALLGTPLAGAANAASAAFDAEYAKDLAGLDASGLNVVGVNIAALFNTISANPSQYGFSNTTQACLSTPGCNPNTYLYFDTEHPTTAADALIASAAFQSLTPAAPTPEPASVTLVALGAVFVSVFAYTRRRPQLQA